MTTPLEQLGAALADRYRVDAELGRGGMGVVYRAYDKRHNRFVAIKAIGTASWSAPNAERFLREIAISARLTHPHILPLFDSGEAAGLLYYVSPLVEGESLRHLLERERRLPIADAVRIASEVADGLDYAHREGVIHRDVKPENILLAQRHAVLADFGVARALAASDVLTLTGALVGTRAYMSPEQASGDTRVDGRADIYSLGCVLFEMLVGERPFTIESDATIRPHTDPVTLLRTERPDVPRAVEQALMRALARSRELRFATAGEFSTALLGRPQQPRVRAFRLPRKRRLITAAAVTAVVLLGGSMVTRWPRASPLDPQPIVALPFHVSGSDPALQFLREGMVDLLAARLGATRSRVVEPARALAAWRASGGPTAGTSAPAGAARLAREFGAGRAIMGSIVGSPARFVLSASLLDARNGSARGHASAEGPADSLPSLIDRVTAQLLALEAGEAKQRLSELTSTSLPALRAYLDGQTAHRNGAYVDAFDHFARAVELDSTFALAALNALYITLWGFVQPERSIDRAIQVAFANRNRLNERDRVLLTAFSPTYPEQATEAQYLVAREHAVVVAPERPEAWFWYGAALFNAGRAMDYDNWLQASDSAFRRALALDSSLAAALQRLIEVRIAAGDTSDVRVLAARFFTRFPNAEYADYLRWRVAVALGDDSARALVRRRFDGVRPSNLYRLIIFAQLDGVAQDDADSAMAALLRSARSREERTRSLLLLQGLMLNRGRPHAALAATESLRAVQHEGEAVAATGAITQPHPNRIHLWLRIGHALHTDGDTSAAAAAARALEPFAAAPVPSTEPERSWRYDDICWHEQWRLRAGPSPTAAASAATMRSLLPRETHCPLVVEVLQALAAGDQQLAHHANKLDSVLRDGPVLVGIPNRVIARARERLGDLEGARSTLRRRINGNNLLFQFLVLPALATTLREEGRISVALGDRDGAIRAYRHYLALRTHPEPQLEAQVDSVRRALVRLLATESASKPARPAVRP